MSSAIALDIIHKACALLGVEMGVSRASTATRAEKLAHTFIESAMEEAFLACPWPFSIAEFRDYAPGRPNEFEKVMLRGREGGREEDRPINDCLRVLVIAPSQGREWYIDAQSRLWVKGGKIDACFYQSSVMLDEIMGKRGREARVSYFALDPHDRERNEALVPDLFAALASFSLAANVAYSLQSDAAFADGLRLQYMKKLEECKRQMRLEGFIENAYRAF
jgi:hypothetical protein